MRAVLMSDMQFNLLPVYYRLAKKMIKAPTASVVTLH